MHHVEVHNRIRFIIAIFQQLRFWDVEDKNVYSKKMKVFIVIFYATATLVQLVKLSYIILRRSEILAFIHHGGCYTVENEDKLKQPHELVIVIYPLNLETFRMLTSNFM